MKSKKICLHLGVHKTASTHLQQTLNNQENRAVLNDASIQFYGPETLRPRKVVSLVYSLSSTGENFVKTDNYKKLVEKVGALLAQNNAEKIVLSDENLVGSCAEVLTAGVIYPNFEQRLKILAKLFEHNDIEISVCIREMSSYLVSAYCEALRGTRKIFPFQKYVQKLEPNTCKWIGYLEMIRSIFPNAKINIWNFEDLKKPDFHGKIFDCLLEPGISEKLIKNNRKIRSSIPKSGILLLNRVKDLLTEKEADSLIGLLDDPKMKWEHRSTLCPWSNFEKFHWNKVQAETSEFLEQRSDEFNLIL
ncbi:MAG: hypothetical protein AB8D78_11555 [Akkermansiaceae bacterium]